MHYKINGISEINRINSSNLKKNVVVLTTLMKLSEKIDHFRTEIVDVGQQSAEGYGFVIMTVKRMTKFVLFSYINE